MLIHVFAIEFFPTAALYQFLKNGQILLYRGLFYQEEECLQHDHFQF